MKKKKNQKHKRIKVSSFSSISNTFEFFNVKFFNVKAENSTIDLTLEVGSKGQKKATNIITRDKCRLEKNEGFSPQYIYQDTKLLAAFAYFADPV